MKSSHQLLERLEAQRLALESSERQLASRFVEITMSEGSHIPFLPIRAFRDFEIHSGSRDASGAVPDSSIRFFSSGTTQAKRGVHIFSRDGIAAYEQGACEGFVQFLRRFQFSQKTPLISLIPPVEVWPQSSLAAMIAMFARSGFDIRYANLDGDWNCFLECFASVEATSDLIVFGTSFHHIMLQRKLHRERRASILCCGRLGIIDTGGTKGRTEAFAADSMRDLLIKTYAGSRDLLLLSEYGMCELASQAYSLRAPHDGVFVCNPGLIPICIDIASRTELPAGEKGFLGFLDSRNQDSFMAILTEDLGRIIPDEEGRGVFELCGRAPDATIKGCSLNVRDEVIMSAGRDALLQSPHQIASERALSHRTFLSAFKEGFAASTIARLSVEDWSEPQRAELLHALRSVEGAAHLVEGEALGRRLQIVASANIPITWLFPTIAAAALGFDEIVVNLPSMRPDDPFSSRVRRQIASLARALATEIMPASLRLVDGALLDPSDCGADTLVVFGSDATCSAFARRFSESEGVRLLTFGDLRNSISIAEGRPSLQTVASLCASWEGRGCLTPLVIFNGDHFHEPQSFARGLAEAMDGLLAASAPLEHREARFLHAHDLLELEAVLRAAGQEGFVQVVRRGAAIVVDFRSVLPEKLEKISVDYSCAGAGLVFLLGDRKEYPWLDWISSYPCRPGISDAHMGKSWFAWLSVPVESAQTSHQNVSDY